MEQELAIKLSQIVFQIQVEISVAIADFCFALDPRPLLVFVDRPGHLARAQMIRDKETRSYLRKKGCKTLELALRPLQRQEKRQARPGNRRNTKKKIG